MVAVVVAVSACLLLLYPLQRPLMVSPSSKLLSPQSLLSFPLPLPLLPQSRRRGLRSRTFLRDALTIFSGIFLSATAASVVVVASADAAAAARG